MAEFCDLVMLDGAAKHLENMDVRQHGLCESDRGCEHLVALITLEETKTQDDKLLDPISRYITNQMVTGGTCVTGLEVLTQSTAKHALNLSGRRDKEKYAARLLRELVPTLGIPKLDRAIEEPAEPLEDPMKDMGSETGDQNKKEEAERRG